jgi:hypothetical protein
MPVRRLRRPVKARFAEAEWRPVLFLFGLFLQMLGAGFGRRLLSVQRIQG